MPGRVVGQYPDGLCLPVDFQPILHMATSPFSYSASLNLKKKQEEEAAAAEAGDGRDFGTFRASAFEAPGRAPRAVEPAASAPPQVPAASGGGYTGRTSISVGGADPGTSAVGGFKYSNGQRVEVRGDGREAVYGPGNKFQGYRGGSTTGGGGSDSAPAREPIAEGAFKYTGSSLTPAAEVERRKKAQMEAEAARAEYSAARAGKGLPAVSVSTPAPLPRPGVNDSDRMRDSTASVIHGDGSGPFQLVHSTRDAKGYAKFRGVTKSGKSQVFDTEAEASAFSSQNEEPTPAATATPPSTPARVGAPALLSAGASPFTVPDSFSPVAPKGFMDGVNRAVDGAVPAIAAQGEKMEKDTRKARVDLATSGSGGSANSRSVIPGVNAPVITNAINAAPVPSATTGRSNATIEAEREPIAAARNAQSAAQWDKRMAEQKTQDEARKKREEERLALIEEQRARRKSREPSMAFQPAR